MGGWVGGGVGGGTKWVTYGFSLPGYLSAWQLPFRKIFRKILVFADNLFSYFFLLEIL